MMKLKLSVITMVLLCATSTISSRLQEYKVGGSNNSESNATAIFGSNLNQSQNEEELKDQQYESKKVRNHTSIYTGVSWSKRDKKWAAQLTHNKKLYHGGNFDNEKYAAMKVNLLCDKYGMERKNPTIEIELDVIQQVENQTSKYAGVCWHKCAKKWKAQITHDKKEYYGGLFENEEHAAMKVNSLCDRLGIEHKNPTIDIEADKIQRIQNKTSKYTGVYWNKYQKKWKSELQYNKKKYSGRFFENEEHAAMKVNLLCDEFRIERKNPMIIIEPDAIQQQFINHTSIYFGVSWKKDIKKWRSQLTVNKKKYYGGNFDKEEDAAMSINLLCDKFEVERKNPTIDIKLFEACKVHNSSSKYIGVFWNEDAKKWQAQLTVNKKRYYGGHFDKEEDAAMSINLLCDKFEVERKNPTIDIKLFEASQKTKFSKKYRSKAENIVNEKEVKVEEEYILFRLKNQCENNFMKKSYQSQKRKRKLDSILDNVIEEQMVNTTSNHDGNEVFEELQKDYIKILD